MVGDATHLYWVTDPGGTVARLAHASAGGMVETLASGLANPTSLAITTAWVYSANAGTGDVTRTPKEGGAIPEVMIRGLANPCGVAADDSALYVTDCTAGTVTRLAL